MGILNIRPFPDDLHRILKVEAARRGMSIKALVVEIVGNWAKREVKQERIRTKK